MIPSQYLEEKTKLTSERLKGNFYNFLLPNKISNLYFWKVTQFLKLQKKR